MIESIRRGWEEFNRGNREPLTRLVAPEGELHPPRERMTGGPPVYYGPEGWAEYATVLDEVLDELSYEVEGHVEAPGGAIIADMVIRGTGVGSGAPFEQHAAHVYEVDGGLITRMRVFMDRGEARRAAGVPE